MVRQSRFVKVRHVGACFVVVWQVGVRRGWAVEVLLGRASSV